MGEQDTRKTGGWDAGQDAKATASRPRKKTSRLAIAALILGVAGVLLFVGMLVISLLDYYWGELFVAAEMLAMSGLVVGLIALVMIRKSSRPLGGRGLALTGIFVALCFIVLVNLLIALSRPTSQRYIFETRCKTNLRQIAGATQAWALEYGEDGGYYPPSMRALYDDGVIEDIEIHYCPVVRKGLFCNI